VSVAYSSESRTAMSAAPLNRILIETDCPVRYKEGEDYFSSEPKDVIRTLKALAELKQCDQEQTLTAVNANARAFFGV
jgi:Tat protein secretion system quality control protein TatD with DNase activity